MKCVLKQIIKSNKNLIACKFLLFSMFEYLFGPKIITHKFLYRILQIDKHLSDILAHVTYQISMMVILMQQVYMIPLIVFYLIMVCKNDMNHY